MLVRTKICLLLSDANQGKNGTVRDICIKALQFFFAKRFGNAIAVVGAWNLFQVKWCKNGSKYLFQLSLHVRIRPALSQQVKLLDRCYKFDFMNGIWTKYFSGATVSVYRHILWNV